MTLHVVEDGWLYPTPELVIRLAKDAAGIEPLLRDVNALEAACAAPRQTAFGDPLCPDVASKAAAIGRGIISMHPFVDGNKRVGTVAMLHFLHLNGYLLQATDRELFVVIMELASGGMSREDLVVYMRGRLTGLTGD